MKTVVLALVTKVTQERRYLYSIERAKHEQKYGKESVDSFGYANTKSTELKIQENKYGINGTIIVDNIFLPYGALFPLTVDLENKISTEKLASQVQETTELVDRVLEKSEKSF